MPHLFDVDWMWHGLLHCFAYPAESWLRSVARDMQSQFDDRFFSRRTLLYHFRSGQTRRQATKLMQNQFGMDVRTELLKRNCSYGLSHGVKISGDAVSTPYLIAREELC
ncbi:unnamed protein product [Nippostrongylus brasiliensis]|uniref:HTH_48 domain-containing protein n=1 Tax=Nippostrongylus brasiliensis TaxID=27835 RepID=A0A0N4Y4K3_NIPBR|nr:unnamed protein product [Nippostrongylus brasiliensis]